LLLAVERAKRTAHHLIDSLSVKQDGPSPSLGSRFVTFNNLLMDSNVTSAPYSSGAPCPAHRGQMGTSNQSTTVSLGDAAQHLLTVGDSLR
jgi:hypothetical protein